MYITNLIPRIIIQGKSYLLYLIVNEEDIFKFLELPDGEEYNIKNQMKSLFQDYINSQKFSICKFILFRDKNNIFVCFGCEHVSLIVDFIFVIFFFKLFF